MRANVGNGRVRTWRKLAGLTVTAILALSVIGVGTAIASTPAGWVAGYGTNSSATAPQPTSGASTSVVSAGNNVGFYEWLRNDGPSNISQLFVNAATPSASTATLVGAKWSINDSSGTLRTGDCPVAADLVCSFGAVNAGQTVYLIAAYTIGANVANKTSVSVTFDWNTTGVPPGKNKSHGDATSKTDSVTVAGTDNADAAGNFNFSQGGITVADNQTLSASNAQATSGAVSSTLPVGAYVADGASVDQTFKCDASLVLPASFNCKSLSSEWSQVEVGNGETFANASGGPGIQVLITFSKLPSGLKGSNPTLYHYWTTLALDSNSKTVTVPHAELITALCTFDEGRLPTNGTSCLTVINNTVLVYVFHNGLMKG
jgi:hypothetical protein